METNFDRLCETMLNCEHVVCGRTLRPYCLWHMLNLRRIGSPFYRGGKTGRFDLLAAVAICASDLHTPVAELKPSSPVADWDFETESQKFRAYRRDFFAPPKQMDGKGKPVQTPFELAIVARLMRYGRMSWDEAWMFPQALWLSPALGEANGGDPGLISAADEKAMAQLGDGNAG